MNTITITEALVAELVERENVDATNAIALLRNAQAVVVAASGIHSSMLNTPRPVAEVDDILIHASHNGRRDLFAGVEA